MTTTKATPVASPSQSGETRIPERLRMLRRTFASGRTRPIAYRRAQLKGLKRMLREQNEAIVGALHADLGKSVFEGWLSEVDIVDKEIDFTLKRLARWMKPERVGGPLTIQPARCEVVREPLGVVLIISPWNYPFQLTVAPLVGALAAGNAVVIKPSEVAPKTSAVLAEVLPAYLDREAVTVVEGGVPETTELLEQRFDHIFYTGSGPVGRIVMAAAAKHLTPVTLELGGKSPAIVDRSADLRITARRLVMTKFFNAGQTCVAPDYVLAHGAVEAELNRHLALAVREFYGEDPSQSADLGRIINERHHDRLVPLLADGEVVVGGAHRRDERYIAPTVLRGVSADAPVMADEIFGPILPVLTYANTDEAIRLVTARPKPLALYVFAQDSAVIDRLLAETSSGGACVNDALLHLTVPGLPFGGVGESGMGAYHGRTSFETFSHRKSVLRRGYRPDMPLRYPPFTERKRAWLRRLLKL